MIVAIAFVSLAAVWGASFLFLRLAVPDFGPVLSAELRVGIAWIALTVISVLAPLWRFVPFPAGQVSSNPRVPIAWWKMALVGLTNSALPFALYGFAALSLPAGYLAILNALVPLWGGLIAAAFLGQPLRWTLFAAVGLAALGISQMVRLGPVPVDMQTLLAALACAAATLCYAVAGQLTRLWLSGVTAVRSARTTLGYASLCILPFVGSDLQTASPTPIGWGAVLALGLVSSALAYLLFFWLLKRLGLVRASSVTFLIPAFGVVWGTVFLGEPLGAPVLIGLSLVVLASILVQRH